MKHKSEGYAYFTFINTYLNIKLSHRVFELYRAQNRSTWGADGRTNEPMHRGTENWPPVLNVAKVGASVFFHSLYLTVRKHTQISVFKF